MIHLYPLFVRTLKTFYSLCKYFIDIYYAFDFLSSSNKEESVVENLYLKLSFKKRVDIILSRGVETLTVNSN